MHSVRPYIEKISAWGNRPFICAMWVGFNAAPVLVTMRTWGKVASRLCAYSCRSMSMVGTNGITVIWYWRIFLIRKIGQVNSFSSTRVAPVLRAMIIW
ncbi:hypothetical protein D3C85_1326800 [compost metagenome]